MKPLKRGHEASKETVTVIIKGQEYEAANLYKSAILVRSKILLAVNEIWHEVDVINLGADDSNLEDFKNFVDIHNLTLSDLGIITEQKTKTDYSMKHDDFVELEKQFPSFPYFKISILDRYLKESNQKSGMYSLRIILKSCVTRGITIEEFIADEKQSAQDIINLKPVEMTKTASTAQTGTVQLRVDLEARKSDRIALLEKLEFDFNKRFDGYLVAHGTAEAPASTVIAVKFIEETEPAEWNSKLEEVYKKLDFPVDQMEFEHEPVQVKEIETVEAEVVSEPETPAKKPVSLEVIGNLNESRISEFVGLKASQEEIIKKNPIIKVTDKKTYEQAKKSRTALLKASTAIDGKDGIESNAKKYIKQFTAMVTDSLKSFAKLTRDKYNEQDVLIKAYESAEDLRIQNEQKAKLEKIKTRTDLLFSTGFVMDGTNYVLGTVYVLPSNVESMTDEEFSTVIEEGKTAKSVIDSQVTQESEKDKMIRELQEKIAALTGGEDVEVVVKENVNTEPAPVSTEPLAQNPVQKNTAPVSTVTNPSPTNTDKKPEPAPMPFKTSVSKEPVFKEAVDNPVLNSLDLANMAHLENPNYIKSREWYKTGSFNTAQAIRGIFAGESKTKAQDIKDLLTVIENS